MTQTNYPWCPVCVKYKPRSEFSKDVEICKDCRKALHGFQPVVAQKEQND